MRPLPFPAASLAATVASQSGIPLPPASAQRQVLVFDPETYAHKGYTARRQALRDHERHWALYDPVFHVAWRPWPAAPVDDLRAALIARYPLFAALAQLGVAAGLDQHTDPLAQAALWMEEIARAIRHRLSRQEHPRHALSRPVADTVPPAVQRLVTECLHAVAAALRANAALLPHPADGRSRSLAAALALNPDEPGWTDYLPWTPQRHAAHDGTLAHLAQTHQLTATALSPYLLHLARATLDTDQLFWDTPLPPAAYQRVDAALSCALAVAATSQRTSAPGNALSPRKEQRS